MKKYQAVSIVAIGVFLAASPAVGDLLCQSILLSDEIICNRSLSPNGDYCCAWQTCVGEICWDTETAQEFSNTICEISAMYCGELQSRGIGAPPILSEATEPAICSSDFEIGAHETIAVVVSSAGAVLVVEASSQVAL